jgi:hypothetical protein
MEAKGCSISQKTLLYLMPSFASAKTNLIALSSYKSQFKPSANQLLAKHLNLTVVNSSFPCLN